MNRSRRTGFTLPEVTVALIIGSMAVMGAAALLSGLEGRGKAVRLAAEAVDARANGLRALRSAVANMDPGLDSLGLHGDTAGVTFPGWCSAALGWDVPCSVRVTFERNQHQASLVLESIPLSPGQQRSGPLSDRIRIPPGVDRGRIVYLAGAGFGGSWTEAWSERTLPEALGIVTDGDTLIVPIRPHG